MAELDPPLATKNIHTKLVASLWEFTCKFPRCEGNELIRLQGLSVALPWRISLDVPPGRRTTPSIFQLREERCDRPTEGLEATTFNSSSPVALVRRIVRGLSQFIPEVERRFIVALDRDRSSGKPTVPPFSFQRNGSPFCTSRTTILVLDSIRTRGILYASPRYEYYDPVFQIMGLLQWRYRGYRQIIKVKSRLIVNSYTRGENPWFSLRNWDNVWKAGAMRGRDSLRRDHQHRLGTMVN